MVHRKKITEKIALSTFNTFCNSVGSFHNDFAKCLKEPGQGVHQDGEAKITSHSLSVPTSLSRAPDTFQFTANATPASIPDERSSTCDNDVAQSCQIATTQAPKETEED